MNIERIDLRDADRATIEEIHNFSAKAGNETRPEGDPIPPLEHTVERLKNLPDFLHVWHYLVREDDDIVASANVSWQIAEDNQHLAQAGITVLPEHRRKGIATRLLPLVVDQADQAKRTMLFGGTNELVPAGNAFCERIGATAAIRDHTNRLLIADVDREMVARWVAEGPARAEGYSLVWHEGPYGDLVERVVPVHRLMNHAPREDLDMEDWVITPEQIRAWDELTFAVPVERWSVFAQRDATGEWIGFTEVVWTPARPKTVDQQGTAVDPDHRGHALGKWLKAAMLERIMRERPTVEDVRTGNADSNEPMLAINTQLGFKPFRGHTGWQVPVEVVRAYLAGVSA